MSDYIASLRKVKALQPLTILPGHGEAVDDAAALIDEYIAHRLEREAQVLAAAQGRAEFTPMQLVPTLYAGYPPEVYPLAAWTVQAHLDKLVRDGEHRPRCRRIGRRSAALRRARILTTLSPPDLAEGGAIETIDKDQFAWELVTRDRRCSVVAKRIERRRR